MHAILAPPPCPPTTRPVRDFEDTDNNIAPSWTKRWPVRRSTLPILISIIVPCKNAEPFLDECMRSISTQGEFIDPGFIELSVFDDGSTDDSVQTIQNWGTRLTQLGFSFLVSGHTNSRGCGYARNRAVAQSRGQYLCFLDSDDIMLPERCAAQLSSCWKQADLIVGSMYLRIPINATARYAEWHNTMTKTQLVTQQFKQRGRLERIDTVLLLYRYHPAATSFSVHCDTILRHKVAHLEAVLLSSLPSFSIWGGKHGREVYRSISPAAQVKVRCFLDIDPRKIGNDYVNRGVGRRVPVLHWSAAAEEGNRPVIVCVKPGLTEGAFEANLDSLGLTEGRDFWYFA